MLKQISIAGTLRTTVIAMAMFVMGCETNTYEMRFDAVHASDTKHMSDAGSITTPALQSSTTPCIGRDVCERRPQRIPLCSHSLKDIFVVDSKSAPGPRSNQYQSPSAERRDALFEAMASVDLGESEEAMLYARIAGYSLCRIHDVFVLFPDRPKLGGARVAWRKASAEPLVLEAPHTFYDLGTDSQALELFEHLKARALLVSGTHRCASERESRCDGSGHVCSGPNRPFKDSDMAHSMHSFFQVVHEYLVLRYDLAWILSLHGMSDDGVSISDGTINALDKEAAAVRLGLALMEDFPEEYVSSCNAWEGAKVEHRLCGTTNVQGRFVNGAKSPCTDEAPKSSGRFIHLEQSLSVRSQTFRVAAALRMALAR